MDKKYIYNGKEYLSLWSLRQAIGEQQGIAYGNPTTVEEFAALGIVVEIVEYDPFLERPLETVKAQLKERLDREFTAYRESKYTWLMSSLGFKVNANVTAFDNVSGVIIQVERGAVTVSEDGTIGFTDFDDQLRMLDLEQLKTIQTEISVNGSRAYGVKWAYRQQIEAATDHEELRDMVFNFEA